MKASRLWCGRGVCQTFERPAWFSRVQSPPFAAKPIQGRRRSRRTNTLLAPRHKNSASVQLTASEVRPRNCHPPMCTLRIGASFRGGARAVAQWDGNSNLRPKVRRVFNSSESLYSGNFGIADYESEVKIPKNKMADPVRQKI